MSFDHQREIAYHHPAPKILNLGATGKGKTYSLATFIKSGITPFILFTEPHMDVIARYLITEKIDESAGLKVHWRYIPPAALSWESLLDVNKKINQLSYKMLTGLDELYKSQHGQILEVLRTLGNFTSDRDGKQYGAVDSWGTDRAICIDTLSGLSIMAMDAVVGAKPVKNPGDWNIAMTTIETLMNKLVTDCKCWVVVNAHLEQEKDELTGGVKLMASTLGRKLAPKVPRFFTDVIESYTEEQKFLWRTFSGDTDLKAHHLPIFTKGILQDYGLLVRSYRELMEVLSRKPAAVAA
jgi:hypothetical protein